VERFLVISPHTAGDCVKALKEIHAVGYITHFEWGCMDGDHTGWVTLEAESAQQALMVVPAMQRQSAKAIRLVKFSPQDIEAMHVK
jgi:hypothetical protein